MNSQASIPVSGILIFVTWMTCCEQPLSLRAQSRSGSIRPVFEASQIDLAAFNHRASRSWSDCRVRRSTVRTQPGHDRGRGLVRLSDHADDTPLQDVEIDVLFAYSEASVAGAGSHEAIQNDIETALHLTNEAYRASKTGVQFNLVHIGVVNYQESGDVAIDVGRLRNRDVSTSAIQSLRSLYQVDIVCLLVERDNYWGGGVANLPNQPSEYHRDNSNLVVYREDLSPGLLAHELAHIFGCDHDREAATNDSPITSYAFGTRFTVDNVLHRTIMAYHPGVRYPLFSSPDVTYRGVPTGIPQGEEGEANNAEVIRRFAPTVASYYDAATRVEFIEDRVEVNEAIGTLTVSIRQTHPLDQPVGGRILVANGSAEPGNDFTLGDSEFSFGPGETETTVEVEILKDELPEDRESIHLTLRPRRAGRSIVALGKQSEIEIQIYDKPQTIRLSETAIRVSESEAHLSIHVSRAKTLDASSPLSFPYTVTSKTAQSGSDFESVQGTIQFDIGESQQRVLIPIIDDNDVEQNEEFLVTIGELETTITILDNDRPGTMRKGAEEKLFIDGDVREIVPLPNKKLYIGGRFTKVEGESRTAIARLNADGSLDKSFNAGKVLVGLELHPATFAPFASKIIPQDNGQIYMIGYFNRIQGFQSGGIARLNPDGAVDTEFVANPGADFYVADAIQQEDGKIVIVGRFKSYNGVPAPAIARINVDGSLDTTFKISEGPTGWAAFLEGIAARDDGKLIVTGFFTEFNGAAVSNIVRLFPDGSVDTALSTSKENIGLVVDATIALDGRSYIYGYFDRFNRGQSGKICLINQDGTVDRTFRVRPSLDSEVRAAIVAPNGDLLIAGAFAGVGGADVGHLLRVHPDGAIHSGLSLDKGPDDHVYTMALSDHQTLWVGGRFRHFDGIRQASLARINIDQLEPITHSLNVEEDAINLSIRGFLGQQVQIEQSSDLARWRPLTTTTIRRLNQNVRVPRTNNDLEFFRARNP